jgi:hypothetical protein
VAKQWASIVVHCPGKLYFYYHDRCMSIDLCRYSTILLATTVNYTAVHVITSSDLNKLCSMYYLFTTIYVFLQRITPGCSVQNSTETSAALLMASAVNLN